jgi:maltose alpha-D-glucosyltransferase/alpha-amylase
VLYYGDEIGMGDNVYLGDRDGVRTPMQWSADKNAGFSRANPQRLYLPIITDPEYHYEAHCVDSQQSNPASLLRWMKRLIDVRKQDDVFGNGDFAVVPCDNPAVLAFIRGAGDHRVLVCANLSRHTQHANLDLVKWSGRVPVEMFGRATFPAVTDRPYPLSFAAHAFYWFQLEVPGASAATRPSLAARGSWSLVADQHKNGLAKALATFCRERRWFRGKARKITGSRLVDVLKPESGSPLLFCVLELDYAEGAADRYLIPLAFADGEAGSLIEASHPGAVVASLEVTPTDPERMKKSGILFDALATGEAATVLLESLRGHVAVTASGGALHGRPSAELEVRMAGTSPAPRVAELEQSNSTVIFGDRVILKVFRQLEEGINAEVEVGEFLTAQQPRIAPPVLGSISWQAIGAKSSAAVAVVHELVPNQGTAWDFMVRELEALLDDTLSGEASLPSVPASKPLALLGVKFDDVGDLAGHLRHARRLGERTAAMHNVLSTGAGPDFVPENWNAMYQTSLYQGARSLLQRTFDLLEKQLPSLPPETHAEVQQALAARGRVDALFRTIAARPISSRRIRSHGDLHLGQVLFTGDDFVIIDFEGEPARPLRERRYKRAPLRDVAGMLRSFSYVAESTLRAGRLRALDQARLRPWTSAWTRLMSAAFLECYLATVDTSLKSSDEDRQLILDFFMAEKCIYEVGYELNNRPGWLPIPVTGLLEILGEDHR